MIASNNQVLSDFNNDNNIFFGLHLRHSLMHDKEGLDYGEVGCLETLIKAHKSASQHCVILLATDRIKKLQDFTTTAASLGCSLVTSNHTYTLYVNRPEHGPFTGSLAMLDLELLSRSDFMIGSTYAGNELAGASHLNLLSFPLFLSSFTMSLTTW